MQRFIDADGKERWLGNIVPTANASERDWTVYGDVPQTPLVPASQWEELCAKWSYDDPEHPHLPYVHDQDGIGQCNADATVAGLEFTRACMGLDFVQLSAADLYDRINGGTDRGSLLEDAMAEMMARGVGTAATAGTLWRRGMRGSDASERARFKVPEAYLCPTFAHCFSAVLSGFAIVSGIMWYDNFNTDAAGWLPLGGAGNAGGHAIFGYKPTMRKYGSRTVFGIWHQNSWTRTWGRGGRMVLAQSLYSGPVGGWWAIRTATDEGGDVPAPKFPATLKFPPPALAA